MKPRHQFPTASMVCAVFLLVTAVSVSGCSRSDEKGAAEKNKPAAAIAPVEGMKYYVGGPIMDHDKYGRIRLAGFNGEIGSPTTRGLLIGFKQNEDRTFDYRTWLNGEIISQSTGFLDADGLLWYSDRVSYDANGDVVVRQKFVYDDEKQVMLSTMEHIDPADGTVVKEESQKIPYVPTEDEATDGEGETQGGYGDVPPRPEDEAAH